MARLDRLGPAREVAQIGAVIGRDFSYPLLRAVAGMEDAPLQKAPERLAEADIVLVQGLPPDADYFRRAPKCGARTRAGTSCQRSAHTRPNAVPPRRRWQAADRADLRASLSVASGGRLRAARHHSHQP
jgi:hypothetical protein